MNFDKVFTVNKEFGEDTFLRELIIELGTKANTPIDVVDAEFGAVSESVREVIVCTASVTGTCSASIGYDRQEPYTDYETYKEKVGDTYVTRQRPVTKYRTVTDWQPYQTSYSGKATCAAYNSSDFGFDDSEIVAAIKSTNPDNIILGGEAFVDPTGLSKALASCKHNVELEKVRLPGDRNRNVCFDSDADILSTSCYLMPYYEVEYTYQGIKYVAGAFACGDIDIYAQTPPNDIDVTAVVKEKTAHLQARRKTSWTLFTVAIIATAVLCFVLKFPWLFPLPILLLLKAKADSDKYSKTYEKCSDELTKNIKESKISAINASLERHGYNPMSKTLTATIESNSIRGAEPLKPIKARVIWSWIFTIILTIASVVSIASIHKANMHSPNQLKLKVVSMESEYDPNASPYINGCYYVHFDYEIEAKKTGIDCVDVTVYVSDKKGNEIGYITSSLSDIHVEAGDKKIVTTSLEENRPENNEFFTELYNSDFSDLEFEYEVTMIQFTDGQYYSK